MSVALTRADRWCGSPAPVSAKKTGVKRLRIGAEGDALEREADRVADHVAKGANMPEWSFARADAGRIQRQPSPDPANQGASQEGVADQQAPQPNNYKDAAGKLTEAFLQTDVGKKLKDTVTKDPLVKDAEDFVGTLPGKIVVGAAAAAAVSTLAATHKALPMQIPEIPLDVVHPGLKVKLTYEGAVDRPTKAMITFSFTPGGDKKKKEPTATQRRLAETAPIAASMDEIRARMSYAPGTPQAQEQAQQQADEKKMFDRYATRRIGALPGTDGVPLLPATGAGQAGSSGSAWTFSPLVHPELDKKLDLQPSSSSSAAKPDADKKQDDVPVQRKAKGDSAALKGSAAVDEVLSSQGHSLDTETSRFMERRIGFDFSKVRVHSDARAAESAHFLNARAYTVGPDVVFGAGEYAPSSAAGRSLLAHELTHVVQQGAGGSLRESHSPMHCARGVPGAMQRKIDMRDVGRGEQSGFARVPELVTRLNAISTGLTFEVSGSDLTCKVKEGATLSNFDTQMQGFIDQTAVIPLRFTNRHGLLGSKATGFNDRVAVDDWSSGYVDIDDLLASNDLGLQNALVHFLRERTATTNYVHRIGSESLNTDPDSAGGAAHQAELDRAHAQGIQAELAVLRDFFSDPTIRLIDHDNGDIFRVYRNGRRDTIRTRVRMGRGANAGVDAVIVEVVTRDGKVHTPEEYKTIVAAPPIPTGAATGGVAAHAP
jgi:hypothetical protein